MWLAVDSGNTRVKWAVVREARITETGASRALAALSAAARKCAGGGAIVSHVGDAKRKALIKSALKPCGSVKFVPPPPGAFRGLHNGYRPPQSLGVDRWLALLAAAQHKKNIIVADAGTALTIDALTKNGTFSGGVIVPGARVMRAALRRGTGLEISDDDILYLPPVAGDNTKTAATAGMTAALAGAILEFRRRVFPKSSVILTGGDAPGLMPWMPRMTRHRPHLVMEGIVRWRGL